MDAAQERYGLRFPPDLVALLLDRRPSQGHDWTRDDPSITEMLAWPTETLLFDVDHGSWWPGWGERPRDLAACHDVVRKALADAPRLIPLIGHRFLPETPHDAGNPVFSMYGLDTIYYGSSLDEYFANEFEHRYDIGECRTIPFWSDLAGG